MPLASAKVRGDLEYFEQEVDDDVVVVVRDPVRGNYFRFNVLQAGMLRALDGVRTPAQIAAQLSEEFEVEVPPAAAERFVRRARELLLLDVASYRSVDDRARKQVARALRRARFRVRQVIQDEGGVDRVASSESALFMAALRQLDRGEPIRAAEYLLAVLELNPENRRAKELHELIQSAFLRAADGGTGFPTLKLFDPSRMLGWLCRTIGPFLFSPWGVLVMLAYVCVGLHYLAQVRFADLEINVLAIVVAVIATRLSIFWHEIGHGLACAYYGGRVTEIGIMVFYYVNFGAYCDTSSSYLFTNRRHKVIVQLAGTAASLLSIASQSILLVVISPELPIYQGLLLTLLLEVTFTFITLIPFLKNDGYFAICDYYDVPNLRDRAFRVTDAWLKRTFLGLPAESEELPPRMRKVFIVYALACFLFTAAFLYFGVFKIFAPLVEWQGRWAFVAATIFCVLLLKRFALRPVVATVRILVREWRAIFTWRRTAIFAGVLLLLTVPWTIRWPVLLDSEFVLVPARRAHVRAQTPGIVEQIFVSDGETVAAGQLLAQLRNDDLSARRRQVEGELKMAEARLSRLQKGARREEIDLASRRLARRAGTYAKSSNDAVFKRQLADARLGLGSDADQATRTSRVDRAMTSAAAAQLHLLRAGALPEELAAGEAERNRLAAQLDQLRAEEERLSLRSPLAGVVVTERVHDRLYTHLDSGDELIEVHDTREFVAELSLPPWAPLSQLRPDAPIVLRAYGSPHDEIRSRLVWVRDVVEGDEAARQNIYRDSEVVAVTSPFRPPVARSGMRGRGRVYGEDRSLAYAHLYLPLKRLFSIRLWSL